jgi:hypothetical protein
LRIFLRAGEGACWRCWATEPGPLPGRAYLQGPHPPVIINSATDGKCKALQKPQGPIDVAATGHRRAGRRGSRAGWSYAARSASFWLVGNRLEHMFPVKQSYCMYITSLCK